MRRKVRLGPVAVVGLVLLALLGLAQPLALAAIDGYQRWISPHKGWRCAYAVHRHGASCSQYAEQSIASRGLIQGLRMLQARFAACRQAQQTLHRLHAQTGTWNCSSNDCDACNLSGTWSCN